MTVSALTLQNTDSIAKPYKFYSAEINVPHHQLRNFISTVYDNRLYYVNNFDIFLLDLNTNQRSLLATVPFEARCLAAAYGWVCVGGETKGDCAFIRLGDEDSLPSHFCHELIVEMHGKEIVNSMTIHRLRSYDAAKKDELVVLISNNDKTVTIYSLSQRETVAILEHPVPMNYALVSPDSTIIAAVGDSNEVFFYQRHDPDLSDPDDGVFEYVECDWRPLAVPKVPRGENTHDDFSFAVAFSSSGHLCAASSQGGAITIFDMQMIIKAKRPPEDAILCSFRSSRNDVWGCVRSMAFSPEPWELLAWAEDHGRIGIADVRQCFLRRQCIDLDQGAASTVSVEDTTPSEIRNASVKDRLRHQHLQRLRSQIAMGPELSDNDRRQQMRPHPETGTDLDARERSVVEALQTTIDDVEAGGPEAFSINYNSSPRLRPSATSAADNSRQYEVQLLNPGSRYLGQREPRRRSSVILSEPHRSHHLTVDEASRGMMTASPGPISDDGTVPPMSTNDLTPSANNSSSQPLPYNIPPSDPWHVIEARLSANRNLRPPLAEPSASTISQMEAAVVARRQLSERLERQLADEQRLSNLLQSETEVRARLLEAQQRQLETEQASRHQLSPSLERGLQRQLHAEQLSRQQRSEQIENEIRNDTRRVDQLMDEQDALLQRLRVAREGNGTSLPTASNSTPASRSLADILNASSLEEETRAWLYGRDHGSSRPGTAQRSSLPGFDTLRNPTSQRIQDFESHIRTLQPTTSSHLRRSSNDRPDPRDNIQLLREARRLAASRAAAAVSNQRNPSHTSSEESSGTIFTPIRRLRQREGSNALGSNADQSTIPRTSELANRVSRTELLMAQRMWASSAIDANGNWTADGYQSLVNASVAFMGPNARAARERIRREAGVGTAGIGWSPDGLSL